MNRSSENNKRIAIVGAGLVGSLLAIYLRRRGYSITILERRGDMRKSNADRGRSINLALSNRGLRALEEAGLTDMVRKGSIAMHGRTMHDIEGNLSFLPYGKQGQYINSVSRGTLNILLMDEAEKLGAKFLFNHKCVQIDLVNTVVHTQYQQTTQQLPFDGIIGADGAFSTVRQSMQGTDRFDYSQDYIKHGYKEFHIPAGPGGSFQLEKNSLHIWPRQSFMMIALPNPDGSFTATLFFPFEGNLSFSQINTPEREMDFLENTFPDVARLMPDALNDFKNNPTSSLLTVRCFPWTKNNTLLIGDAAHAVVPFYGQGMNAGFEDCRILNQLLDDQKDDWPTVLSMFQQSRKADTDAIAQLALDNFTEMRDLVADADFLIRKKIEAKLHELFPHQWIPLYSMVTFHDHIRYSDAQRTGIRQREIMDGVMKTPEIARVWPSLNFRKIVDQL